MTQDPFQSSNTPDPFDPVIDDFNEFDGLDQGEPSYADDFTDPPKKKSALIPALIAIILVGGAGAAAYQFYFKPLLMAQHQNPNNGLPPVTDTTSNAGLPNGVMPSTPNDGTMPPPADATLNSGTADAAMPAPPVTADNAMAPVAAPLVNDGTVPPPAIDPMMPKPPGAEPVAAAPAAAATTTTTTSPTDNNAIANSALPAPIAATGDAASSDMAALAETSAPDLKTAADAVAAPDRLTNTDGTVTAAPANDDIIIKPSLPVATAAAVPEIKPTGSLTPVATNAADDTAKSATPAPVAGTDPAMAKKVAALETRLDAMPTAATMADLVAKLDALNQRLDAMDKRTNNLAALAQSNAQAAKPVVTPLAPTPVAPAITAPADVSPAPAAAPNIAPALPKAAPKPVAKKPAVSAGNWTLRSAQPGAAWLSQSGSEEMTRYAVGQTLPGQGTITAVEQDNGNWVVKTSNGAMIRQ